jgi:hypothetical protein
VVRPSWHRPKGAAPDATTSPGSGEKRDLKLEVLNEWLGRRGLLADRRSGRIRASFSSQTGYRSAYERQLAELHRRFGGNPAANAPPTIAPLELTEAERVGLMASDDRIRAETAHNVLARISDEQHAERMRSEGAWDAAITEELDRRAKALDRARAASCTTS